MLAETFFLEAFIKIQKLGGNNDHEAKSNIMSLFESAYHEFKVSSYNEHKDSFACETEFG